MEVGTGGMVLQITNAIKLSLPKILVHTCKEPIQRVGWQTALVSYPWSPALCHSQDSTLKVTPNGFFN